MPEPPGGFILVSGNTYFNPSTGTYWMAPAPAPAPTPQTMSQPSVVQAPPPERKVTQYALERTSTSTGKTEYATPSGGWSSVNPGPIVSTRAPTTVSAPFVKEVSAQVTKPGDSTPQANAPHEPLRPDLVQFIETNYEGRLAQKWPGEKGYDAYIRVYDTLAKGLPETGKAVKSEISVGGKLIGNESYGYFEFAPKGKEVFKEYYPEASKQIEGMSGTELGEFVPKAYEYETNLALIKYAGGLAQKINYDYIPTIQTLQAKEEPKIPTKTTAESIMEVYQPKTTMEGVLAANLAGTGEPFANLPSKAGFDASIKQSLEVNAKIKESEQYSLGSFSVTSPTLSMTRKLAEYNVGPLSSNKGQLTDVALSAVPLVAAGFVEFPLQVGRTANVAVQEQWGSGFLETFSKGDTLGKIVAFNRQGAERVKTGFSDPYLLATIPIMAAVPVAAKYATAKTGIPMSIQGIGKISGLSKIELINPAHGLTPTTYGIYSATDVASGLSGFPKAPLSPQIEGYMKQGGAVIAKKLYPFSVEGAEGVLKAGAGKVKSLMPKEQVIVPSTDWVRADSGGIITFKQVSGSKVYYGGNFPLENLGTTSLSGVAKSAVATTRPLKISTYKNTKEPITKVTINDVLTSPTDVSYSKTTNPNAAIIRVPTTEVLTRPALYSEAHGKLPLGERYNLKGTLLEERQIFTDVTVSSLKDVETIGSRGGIQEALPNKGGITDFTPFKTTRVMNEYATTNLFGKEVTTGPTPVSVETRVTFNPPIYDKPGIESMAKRVLTREGDYYQSRGQVPYRIGESGKATISFSDRGLMPGETKAIYVPQEKVTTYYLKNPDKIIPGGVQFEDVMGKGGQFYMTKTPTEGSLTVAKTSTGLHSTAFVSPRYTPKFGGTGTTFAPSGLNDISISGPTSKVVALEGGGESTISSAGVAGKSGGVNLMLQITEQGTTTRAMAVPMVITKGASIGQAIAITEQARGVTIPAFAYPITTERTGQMQIQKQYPRTLERTVPLQKTMQIQMPAQLEKTISLQRTMQIQIPAQLEKTLTLERTRQIQTPIQLEKSISLERTIQVQRPVQLEKAVTLERTIQIQMPKQIEKMVTLEKTLQKQKTTQLEKVLQKQIQIPIIQKNIEHPNYKVTEKPAKPPDIPNPTFPLLPGPSKRSSRNWPSMGGLGKLGKFKSKRKLQPLLQPFEQLRIEQRTGKALSAFVPSTPKTRAIYAKNMFGFTGKSGLEGLFKTKRRRKK